MLLVMVEAPIDDPSQEGGDRYPEELIPIEERETEKLRLDVIVEGDPEEPDIRDEEQQPKPRAAGVPSGGSSVHNSDAQGPTARQFRALTKVASSACDSAC
jgi:hypothetical protein